MPTSDQVKTHLANTLQALPQEEVSHLTDALTRPENASMTAEQKLSFLVSADPRFAQILAKVQQTQSGGVNLGADNTIGKIDNVVAGDSVNNDKIETQNIFHDDPTRFAEALIELLPHIKDLLQPPAAPPAPPAPPRDPAIERYQVQFSEALKFLNPQGPAYDFPLTFQLISETGQPIEASAGTPIDQMIMRAQRSQMVILRGSAGAGKTTAMQRLAALIDQSGYANVIPIYMELRRLQPEALEDVSETLEEEVAAESYLEPLLKASILGLSIDTLKRLGDYAVAKESGMLLVMVDGLNEIYGEEAARSILNRLEAYVTRRPGAAVLVSDRITPRDAITQYWQVARIERLKPEIVLEQFKAKQIEAIYTELSDNDRTLLQTAYFLNYALEHNTARLSSAAEAIAAFFEDLHFSDDALDRLAKAAFNAYKKNRSSKFNVEPFALAVGQDIFDKLDDEGVIVRLPIQEDSAPSDPPNVPQAQFDHPLKHDYLVARYLSQHTTEWTPESLDVVSFESNSFDALAMTLELIQNEPQCDTFIQRIHNWNWAAALVCIAKAMRTGSGRHSQEIQFAVLALVAEKMFDPVQQTRKRANEVLALFPQAIAAPYKAIHNLPELYAQVQQQVLSEAKQKGSELWFPKWRDLFARFDSPTFGEQDLKQIVSNQAIIGWTAANVFRRFKLSDVDVRQLRAYYDACSACDFNDWRASTIRSRVVHALGATDTKVVVDLLFEALSQDRYMWARIGAARSLVEIAALTTDAELRHTVIDTLIGMVISTESKILALKTLREIGASAFYRDAHDGWEQAVTPLIIHVRDLQQSEPEKVWWSNLLTDFTAYCQKPSELAVGAADQQPAGN
jgi:hypothetical protein